MNQCKPPNQLINRLCVDLESNMKLFQVLNIYKLLKEKELRVIIFRSVYICTFIIYQRFIFYYIVDSSSEMIGSYGPNEQPYEKKVILYISINDIMI